MLGGCIKVRFGVAFFISVSASKFRSSSTSLACGVPQGSILGPLLFLLYTLSKLQITRRCLDSIKSQMDDNFL